VGVDVGVEDGAGDAGGVGREGEDADIAKVLRIGERGGSVAEGGKGAGLKEERGCYREERLQAVASRVRLSADRCGRGCFPMA